MSLSPLPRPLTPTAPAQPRTAVPTARLTNRARHDHPADAAITATQPQAHASVAIRTRRPHATMAASQPQTAATSAQPTTRSGQPHIAITASQSRTDASNIRHSEVTP